MQAVGSLRNWIQGYWARHGARLMKDAGVESITPQMQREWMLEFIDGDSPSAPGVAKLWLHLTQEEKLQHLLDAFPDEE
jgi:hypothetical protein